jgi:L-threonylcarbamoyladenylate synthase
VSEVASAVTTLRAGGLLVYPTEAVYGLGTALSVGEAGVERVRAAKGSVAERPYLLLVASVDAAFALWSEVTPSARSLAEAAWPAPLTIIGPARAGLPSGVLGEGPVGQPTVAVRVPGDAWLLSLLVALDEPLLSTSANLAGEAAPSRFCDVPLGALAPDLAIDRGDCSGGKPSTLVSCWEGVVVLREGGYPAALGPGELSPSVKPVLGHCET